MKKATKLRGRELAPPFCAHSVCHRCISPLVFSIAGDYMAYASSLSHLLLFPLLFFYPYSSSCMLRSSHAGIATPVFYQAYMAAPLTLILRSQYQGTIHWLAWGRWQKCLCFPSVCMREKEKVERKSTRCNKWRVRDDRACDPVFFPRRFFFALVSLFSLSGSKTLWDVSDVNLISSCLYLWSWWWHYWLYQSFVCSSIQMQDYELTNQ